MRKSIAMACGFICALVLAVKIDDITSISASALVFTDDPSIKEESSVFRFTDDTKSIPQIEAGETQQTAGDVSGNKIETERKFLVEAGDLPSNMKAIAYKFDFAQTYISYLPEMRVRAFDGRYFFTMKRPADDIGLSREEMQVQITKAEYESLLTKKVGQTIHKTRYQFYVGDTFVYVDVYTGNLAGLVVAEVEFESVEDAEKFTPPSWFGKDVTSDKRYKNASLAKDGLPASE